MIGQEGAAATAKNRAQLEGLAEHAENLETVAQNVRARLWEVTDRLKGPTPSAVEKEPLPPQTGVMGGLAGTLNKLEHALADAQEAVGQLESIV